MNCTCGHEAPEDEVCIVLSTVNVVLCGVCAKSIAQQWYMKEGVKRLEPLFKGD